MHNSAPPPTPPLFLWDIFCRVIDNFGDIGVCWRLCADLAARGHTVRLWVDDASALSWMAPGALQNQWPGVQVLDWARTLQPDALAELPPSDVWIEGFGCDIAPEFIAARAHPSRAAGTFGMQLPVWINLEYLSAEPYVERCHGLPSLVMHGPAQGWTKHFFYPGFTDKTGGLLREPGLLDRLHAFQLPGQRRQWLANHGINWQKERLVSLFCYEPAALTALLRQFAAQESPTRLLVTSGRATQAVQAIFEHENRLQPLWNARGALSISYLPPLTQHDYDHLLWACDLNLVRGEDSVVRAMWAGKPFVWQIYPQDDAAHHDKLQAFLDMLEADDLLRQFHRVWNDLDVGCSGEPAPLNQLPMWEKTVQSAREQLCHMDDLGTQLIAFVGKKR